MIIGHGIDIVEHASFTRLISRQEAFLKRCFTANEIATGNATADPVQWFASRFDAKEAVMKALGTGWTQGISWHEIIARPGPINMTVSLTGRAAAIALEKRAQRWLLSISHSKRFSVASTIATDEEEDVPASS